MSTSVTMDENSSQYVEKPGEKLASIRMQKGYSQDYVAGKLHLRVSVIEQIEADDYGNMPHAVFIKGYLRAYAKLLDIHFEPLIHQFNELHVLADKKIDRAALWQNKKQTNKAEHIVRWLTGSFAVIVLGAVVVWWHSNQDNEHLFRAEIRETAKVDSSTTLSPVEAEVKLTDLSKMRSLLSSETQSLEKKGVTETTSG